MGNKQAYEQQQQGKLKEWRAQIDILQAKAAQANASAKIELNKSIEDLNAKRKLAEAKLHELTHAGEQRWEETKSSVDSALQDLGDRIRAMGSHLK